MGASLSIDGDEATHDRLRGVKGSYRAAPWRNACAPRAHAASLATPRSTDFRCPTSPRSSTGSPRSGSTLADPNHGADGRAADEPDDPPAALRSARGVPAARALKHAATSSGALWPGNNIGYFGLTSRRFAATLRGHGGRAAPGEDSGSKRTALSRVPVASERAWTGGNIRDAKPPDIGSARALRYTRDRTSMSLGLLPAPVTTPRSA